MSSVVCTQSFLSLAMSNRYSPLMEACFCTERHFTIWTNRPWCRVLLCRGCFISQVLGWFRCFKLEPLSNILYTPWLISFNGNSLKHEKRVSSTGWDLENVMLSDALHTKTSLPSSHPALQPMRTCFFSLSQGPVCIPAKVELWFICTHVPVGADKNQHWW